MVVMDDPSRRLLNTSELAGATYGRINGDLPGGLWVAGSLHGLAAPAVAIVGTRAPSDAGRRIAQQLAADLGRAGVCVVSGLALGIDAAAHGGALDAGAPTIGVLGSGFDRFFPARNAELARRMIAAGGAVVSPYAPGHPAYPAQFLARNGIVAALADAVVVVEAAARSGSLNTASWAADRSIPVLAFPGDVERPKVAGCLALIRDGAILCRHAGDVLDALGLVAPAGRSVAGTGGEAVDPLDAALLERLRDGPRDAEALVVSCALPPATVLARLGAWLDDGTVGVGSDGRYHLARE